jgi:hypothetical protein
MFMQDSDSINGRNSAVPDLSTESPLPLSARMSALGENQQLLSEVTIHWPSKHKVKKCVNKKKNIIKTVPIPKRKSPNYCIPHKM